MCGLGVAVRAGDLDETAGERAGGRGIGFDTRVDLRAQRILVDGVLDEVGFADTHPPFDGLAVDLDMELQAPRCCSYTEGLTRGCVLCEWDGTRWHLEAIVVPLEGAVPWAEWAKQRVLLAGGEQPDIAPANLGLASRTNGCASGTRQYLATEADTEHWQFALEPFAQELQFVGDPRAAVIFVGHCDATH